MDSVLVLLSTYNGGAYLREQLDSILSQNKVDVTILVRDDGSNDAGVTLNILEEYKNINPDKIIIVFGTNIGWKGSFFELLRLAVDIYSNHYTYYAFSDQDDIWMPDKLITGINQLKKLGDGPSLYCSNLYYYKNGINYGLIRDKKIIPTYKSCLLRNYATGCSVIFNHDLLILAGREKPNVDVAHDYWLYQIAVLCGNVFIDQNAYILYRQHDNNQIGYKSGWINKWRRRYKTLRNTLNHQQENQAKELLRIFSNDMHREALVSTRKFANYRQSILQQLQLLVDSEYTLNNKSNDRWMKIKILLRRL